VYNFENSGGKMKKLGFLALLIVVSVSFTSCFTLMRSLLAPKFENFTTGMKETFSDDDLIRAKFHVSTAIILERELNTGEAPKIDKGKIVIKNGKRIETIIIESNIVAGFIGTIDDGNGENLKIAFEDDDNLFLLFSHQPASSDLFTLTYLDGKNGIVKYGDSEYKVNYDGKTRPFIKIDIDKKDKLEKDSRKAKGRTVNTK
jgi:hypothetical protein